MKIFIQILLILIIFLRTGNLLSDNYLFNVNNVRLEKKDNISHKQLTNQAIKKAFNNLIKKILVKEDVQKVSDLKFEEIRELVAYYNISKNLEKKKNEINFSFTFDKDKIHNLFYKRGVLYSNVTEKEFYILPILSSENEIFIFSNNYFYKDWKTTNNEELIEFILPLENIEIIQKINQSKNSLLDIDINSLLKEYPKENIAIAIIENNETKKNKVYLKTRVQGKIISRSINLDKNSFIDQEETILKIKEEITNLVKSQNLIDIRTPSFLNIRLNLNKKNNLVLLNSKIKKVDLIENIFIQEFNKNFVNLRVKYLGKLDKIISQLREENISLELINDKWVIKIL